MSRKRNIRRSIDGVADGVDGTDDAIPCDTLLPIPDGDDSVAGEAVNLAAVIGDWAGDVEEKLADQRAALDRTQALDQGGRTLDVEEKEYPPFQHWAVVFADHQVEQVLGAQVTDDAERHDRRNCNGEQHQ